MLHWKTGLRPKRSASMPDRAAPRTMPKKLELASSPACAGEAELGFDRAEQEGHHRQVHGVEEEASAMITKINR
jgi:hypothetical protein